MEPIEEYGGLASTTRTLLPNGNIGVEEVYHDGTEILRNLDNTIYMIYHSCPGYSSGYPGSSSSLGTNSQSMMETEEITDSWSDDEDEEDSSHLAVEAENQKRTHYRGSYYESSDSDIESSDDDSESKKGSHFNLDPDESSSQLSRISNGSNLSHTYSVNSVGSVEPNIIEKVNSVTPSPPGSIEYTQSVRRNKRKRFTSPTKKNRGQSHPNTKCDRPLHRNSKRQKRTVTKFNEIDLGNFGWNLPPLRVASSSASGDGPFHRVKTVELEADSSLCQNLLEYCFKNLTQNVVLKCTVQNNLSAVAIRRAGIEGEEFELVSVKKRDNEKSRGQSQWGPSSQCEVNFVYVKTKDREGNHMLNLSRELLKLGDFESLDTRKCIARLELLQSPAYTLNSKYFIKTVPSSIFGRIENDKGCEGCGFIHSTFLDEMVGATTTMLAIQVRIIVPKYGIFKGMLFRKTFPASELFHRNGKKFILLPPSMQKVPASPLTDFHDQAIISIKQIMPGKLDSKVRKMHYELNPAVSLPCKSNHFSKAERREFILPRRSDPKDQKKKKNMMMRKLLEKALKIPAKLIDEYNQQILTERGGIKHSYLVGVADPYGHLGPGQCFVPGLCRTGIAVDHLLITRMPARLREDARILENVCSRPRNMAEIDWNDWNELPLGAIIFGSPYPGMKPIPSQISNGDLDGDWYCCIWSKPLVDYVRDHETAIPIQLHECQEKEEQWIRPMPGDQRNESWFQEIQRVMSNRAEEIRLMKAFTGLLFNLSEDTKDDEILQKLFWKAYTECLDFHKHGRKVRMSEKVFSAFPKLQSFMQFIQITNDAEDD